MIVSTLQDLSLIDARCGISVFRKIDVPILGIVENMAHFVCTTCGTAHPILGEIARPGVPFLGAIPQTMELRRASDRGQPVTAMDPDGALRRAYCDLANRVAAALADTPSQATEGRAVP